MRFLVLLFSLTVGSCDAKMSENQVAAEGAEANLLEKSNDTMEIATFGAGCFWCVEAVFQQIKGVDTVVSGYMGGKIPNPTYREICSGLTGHAEVIQIRFNPQVVGFADLLQVFWGTHDPTTLNRQGADVGTQYRSAVFYHNAAQKELAESIKMELNKSGAFAKPIVTEITAATTFYIAEDYHQNYYRLNGDQPYCRFVIQPKMEKLDKVFKSYLK